MCHAVINFLTVNLAWSVSMADMPVIKPDGFEIDTRSKWQTSLVPVSLEA
jgi:hypothetical protein